MQILSLLLFLSLAPHGFGQAALPRPLGAGALEYACITADDANPVYYESSSAEWSWSPDGSAIVYDRAVGGVSQLRIQEIASGQIRCISSGEFYDTQPSWSPDGSRIAFVRRIEGPSRIHMLDLATGITRPVTRSGVRSEYPTFSRDGRRLAYVRFDPDGRRRFVTVRDLESGSERTVFDSPFGLNNLSWNREGDAVLLYSIDDDGWNDLYSTNADGSGVTRLTDNTVTDTYSADAALDGRRFLFGQGSEDSPYQRWFNYDLYEKDLDVGTVKRLTWSLNADDRGHYSPDGRTIGFVSRRTGYAEIYLMEADGSRLRALTRQPEGELTTLIRDRNVPAGLTRFATVRRASPQARLFSEMAGFVLTRQLIARGQVDDAVVVARIGTDTYPDSWRAHAALGEALLASHDRDGAHRALRRSLAILPNQVQVVFLLGFEDFFDVLSSVEGVWVDRSGDLLDLVHRLQQRGDVLSALELLRRLALANPGDVDIAYRLAHTHMTLGDADAALAGFGRVIALDPDHVEGRFHLARLRGPR